MRMWGQDAHLPPLGANTGVLAARAPTPRSHAPRRIPRALGVASSPLSRGARGGECAVREMASREEVEDLDESLQAIRQGREEFDSLSRSLRESFASHVEEASTSSSDSEESEAGANQRPMLAGGDELGPPASAPRPAAGSNSQVRPPQPAQPAGPIRHHASLGAGLPLPPGPLAD